MRAGHDSNPATGAVCALRTGPASPVNPAFSARTTSPSVPRAQSPHLARPRPYKLAPARITPAVAARGGSAMTDPGLLLLPLAEPR